MKNFSALFKFLRSKYILALVFFVVWMAFFDPKDWGLINSRTQKLKDLHESEQAITAQIKDTRQELGLLKTNAQTIEKYAREKYYMKKDNEELFIVKPQGKSK